MYSVKVISLIFRSIHKQSIIGKLIVYVIFVVSQTWKCIASKPFRNFEKSPYAVNNSRYYPLNDTYVFEYHRASKSSLNLCRVKVELYHRLCVLSLGLKMCNFKIIPKAFSSVLILIIQLIVYVIFE